MQVARKLDIRGKAPVVSIMTPLALSNWLRESCGYTMTFDGMTARLLESKKWYVIVGMDGEVVVGGTGEIPIRMRIEEMDLGLLSQLKAGAR